MNKKSFAVLATVALVSCVSRHQVDYSRFDLYTEVIAGNRQYQQIGPVVAVGMSNLKDGSCQQAVEQAGANLKAAAVAAGGNAVISVRWYEPFRRSKAVLVEQPSCSTQAGWYATLSWVPFVLPGYHRAKAQGIAVKLIDANIENGAL
jgi:hypothetical protein